jgi:hypothetical protein
MLASITLLSAILVISPTTVAPADPFQQPRLDLAQGHLPRQARNFFSSQADAQDKEVGGGDQSVMVMKTAPGAPFVVIEAEIVFDPLEKLFDLPARSGQEQAPRPVGRGAQVGEKEGMGGRPQASRPPARLVPVGRWWRASRD